MCLKSWYSNLMLLLLTLHSPLLGLCIPRYTAGNYYRGRIAVASCKGGDPNPLSSRTYRWWYQWTNWGPRKWTVRWRYTGRSCWKPRQRSSSDSSLQTSWTCRLHWLTRTCILIRSTSHGTSHDKVQERSNHRKDNQNTTMNHTLKNATRWVQLLLK